jgi:hypothetical protein
VLLGSSAVANVLDGSNDVGVSAAAADVAAHQFSYFGVARTARLFEQSDGGHDLTGSAIAALVAIVLNEGGLHGVKIAGFAQSLNGRDRIAFVHDSQRKAGVDPAAVDVDGARSALAMIAALLGACQQNCFAQAVEQRSAGIDLDLERLAVDGEGYGDRVLNLFNLCRMRCGGRRRRLGLNDKRRSSGDHARSADLREERAARYAAGGVFIADFVMISHCNSVTSTESASFFIVNENRQRNKQ